MTSSFRPTTLIVPSILAALGTMTVASAQIASPFAKKNKTQAWETAPAQVPQALPQTLPSNPLPQSLPSNPLPASPLNNYEYRAPTTLTAPQPDWQSYQAPAPQTGSPQTGSKPVAASSTETDVYYPGRRNREQTVHNIGNYESSASGAKNSAAPAPQFPAKNYSQNNAGGSKSPFAPRKPQVQYHQDGGNIYGDPNNPQWGQAQSQSPLQGQQPQYQNQNGQYQGGQYQGAQYQGAQYQGGQYQGEQAQALAGNPNAKRGWKARLGLDKWQTLFRGSATVGAAAVNNADGDSGWGAEFIADGDIEIEVNTITEGGLEYGAVVGARAQYDRFRRGFGQRLPDCPPTAAGCSSANIDGTPTGLRGHTSQFFSDGEDDAQEAEIQLETAYVFLRSAYGDVSLGRDDGAAYLFSLGAPSLLKVGASNSSVDYTGFDSVKTVNDASGYAEKVTYTSPRLLGDTVGVGVQFGASYAPNAIGCGVDNCIRSNFDQDSGTIAADLRNVVEVGVALDRNFGNGLKAELTGSYARADERSGLAGLDDLSSFNAGLELTYDEWVLGGSYLTSNNGLEDGDYEAYDIGLTWKPSKLGFTLGYGHATDDNVNLTSDQFIGGVSYDFNKFTVAGGVQYIDRETDVFDGVAVTSQSEDAVAVFIETGFKF